MCACIVVIVVIFLLIIQSISVTVHRNSQPDIICNTKIELTPLIIPCSPSDIIVISAPVVENAKYYLYNPNGDAIKLDINSNKFTRNTFYPAYLNKTNNNIMTRYAEDKSIYPLNSYKVYSLDPRNFNYLDFFGKYSSKMKPNDFMIGPLLDENHGNWVLSAYQQQKNGECVEMFQVITVEITEVIPANIRTAKLHEGDTFEVSFAYPIAHLESCELSASESAYDRLYARDQAKMESCGYIVKNLTTDDTGMWRIIGVGRIVYRTQVFLEVLERTIKL